MSTHSIAWHEECLQNQECSLNEAQKSVEAAARNAERIYAGILFLKRQIAEARQRGIVEFDRERLLVNRRKAAKKEQE